MVVHGYCGGQFAQDGREEIHDDFLAGGGIDGGSGGIGKVGGRGGGVVVAVIRHLWVYTELTEPDELWQIY